MTGGRVATASVRSEFTSSRRWRGAPELRFSHRSATGPIKKLSLQPGTFDVELDEAYKDHKAAGLQEGRFHVSFGDLNEWLGRMRKPSIERAAETGVSHERAPSSPHSEPSLHGSRRTSVVQTDKINIFKARDGADVKVTIRPVRTPPGRHNGLLGVSLTPSSRHGHTQAGTSR